jgi:hypothetical protein
MRGRVDRGDLRLQAADAGADASRIRQHGDHAAARAELVENARLPVHETKAVLERQHARHDRGYRLAQAVAEQLLRNHAALEQRLRQGIANREQGHVALADTIEMLAVAERPRIDDLAGRRAAEAARDRVAAVHGLPEDRIFPVELTPHLIVLGALAREHHDGTRHTVSGR